MRKRGRPVVFVDGLIPINLYLTQEDADKLDLLSKQTNRSRSDIMRMLVRSARLTGLPEIETEPIGARE